VLQAGHQHQTMVANFMSVTHTVTVFQLGLLQSNITEMSPTNHTLSPKLLLPNWYYCIRYLLSPVLCLNPRIESNFFLFIKYIDNQVCFCDDI